MDARPIDLTKLFEPTTQYHAPLFQRPYVWTLEKQWEPLWVDVRTAADRQTDVSTDNDDVPHFLGAIVLELKDARELTTKNIIDGQQRITSLQLLVAAARTAAREAGEANLAKKLDALLFFEDYLVEDPNDRFKLVPTNGDRVAFRLAVRHDITDLKRIPPGDSGRTMEAYAYFCAAVEEWLSEVDETSRRDKLQALVTVLRQGLRIVVIDIGKDENAQAIFETMNARGTPLLAADLVKNFLFQDAGESRANLLYAQYWSDFDTQTWRREVGAGRVKRPRIDQLLGNWLILRGEGDLHWQELFLDFRKYRRSTTASSEDIFADLRDVAAVYDMLERLPTGSREWLFMYRLEVLEAGTMKPIALRIFGQGGIEDPADRLRALIALESWLVRRMLCRLTTKNYNRVAKDLLDQVAGGPFTSAPVVEFLSSLRGESQLWPDDNVLMANLRTLPYYTAITRGRLRMTLEAVEAELRGPMNLPFGDWNALTIEHVMPQEWSRHWPLPADVPELEARITRDGAKHRLGNLTLVAQPLNSRLSNAAWTAEPDQDQKREALRKHNVYMLNKPLVEMAEWDEKGIRRRGEDLAATILTIWPRPDAVAGVSIAPHGNADAPLAATVLTVPPSSLTDGARRHPSYWDEFESLEALESVEPALGALGRAVMAWVDSIPGLGYTRAQRVPELIPTLTVVGEPLELFTITNEGLVFLALATWDRIPELADGVGRRTFLNAINEAVGASMKSSRHWPRFAAELLYDEDPRRAFLGKMEDLIGRLLGGETALVQLGESVPLPDSNLVAAPDELATVTRSPSAAPTDLGLRYQQFLSNVLERYKALRPYVTSATRVGPHNWFPFAAGRSGFAFVWSVAGGRGMRVELWIDVGAKEQNEVLFDRLRERAADLESQVGQPIAWERLDNRKGCRLAVYRNIDKDHFHDDPELVEWAAQTMARFADVLRPVIKAL